MTNIFMSYRREDNSDAAGRIHDRLAQHFGPGSVYFDIDSIPLGIDFPAHINEHIAGADVTLVIIGDNWLCTDKTGRLRLENPDDFVRVEIEASLARDIPVIPVLVGSSQMPAKTDLPSSLQKLASRNFAIVRSGSDFRGHIEALIRGIEKLIVVPGTAATELPSTKNADNTPAQSARPVQDRFTSTIFGGLGVISVLFLLFSIMSTFPDMRDILLIKIASVLYYGAAGLACIAGFLTAQRGSPSRIVRWALVAGVLVSIGMLGWSFILDGIRMSYDEVAAAWVISAASLVALCGLMLSQR